MKNLVKKSKNRINGNFHKKNGLRTYSKAQSEIAVFAAAAAHGRFAIRRSGTRYRRIPNNVKSQRT